MDDQIQTTDPARSGDMRTQSRDAPTSFRFRDRRTLYAKWTKWALLALIVGVAAIGAFTYWYITRNEVSTDDAFIEGRAVAVAPQVAGTVTALYVTDNQAVSVGDVLLEIDPRAYVAARDQAQGRLGVAQAQLANARINLEWTKQDYPARLAAAQAALASARANQVKADADARRQRSLPKQATSQQDIDMANAALLTSEAQINQAQAAVRQAELVPQYVGQAEAHVKELEAQVALAQAQEQEAALNLSWTRVVASQDGWITRRNVEQGNYVQAGQTVLSIVTPQVWVVANFKESQLTRMHAGQRVDIHVDAYPQLRLIGHVDSLQLGSGSRFTAFPPENATGNFVKIVQRVPVKILIDKGLDPKLPLPLGLSVVPTVHLTTSE